MDALTPQAISPTDPRVLPLIERHLTFARASSPACSVHAMEPDDLSEADATFFVVFDGEEAIAMGAIKPIDAHHGEVKSMHVHACHRGRGLADAILLSLLEQGRADGYRRVSLETGSQDVFAPARAFYLRHGFVVCPPFEGYVEDPASVFMTREL